MLKSEIINLFVMLDPGKLFVKSDSPEAAFLLKVLAVYWNNKIFHT